MSVNLEFMKAGYPPIDIKITNRRRYYDCFTDYHETGSPDAMTELFASYPEQELERYLSIIKTANSLSG
ncbi:MAG: hypothetical protein ACM3X9_13700 [Bacillota bacterium]